MSDADLKANISVSTDVEQATQRTQTSIVSFAKQIQDVQKKFSTFGKDLFLGFFAPMAIFQTVTGLISDSIAKAKQEAKEGLELLAKGETIYANAEEKKVANFFKAKKAREEEMKLAEKGKEEIALQFIKTPEGKKIAQEIGAKHLLINTDAFREMMTKDKRFQELALKSFLETPEGKSYQPIFEGKKDFKSPEGFSNVVGVGANPVIEAMAEQVEIQKDMRDHLKTLVERNPFASTDFTKDNK